MRNAILGVGLACVLAFCSNVFATDFEKVMPDDCIAFIQVNDIKDISSKSSQSGWYRLFNDPKVQEFIKKPVDKFFGEFSGKKDEELKKQAKKLGWTDAQLEEYKKITDPETVVNDLSSIFTGGVSLAICAPKDGKFSGENTPRVYIVADIENKAKLEKYVNLLVANLPEKKNTLTVKDVDGVAVNVMDEGKKTEFVYTITDNKFILTDSIDEYKSLNDALKNGAKSPIASNPRYKKFKETMDGDCDSVMFFDIEKIVSCIPENVADKAADAANATTATADPASVNPFAASVAQKAKDVDYKKIINALGVGNAKSIGMWSKISDEGVNFARTVISIPGEKKGLIKLFSQSAANMTVPAYLPESMAIYEAFRISPQAIYDTVLEISSHFSAGATEKADAGLESIKEKYGVDIKEDVFASIDDEVALGIIAPEAVKDFSGMDPNMARMMLSMDMTRIFFISMKVKDSEKLKTVIQVMQAVLGQENPMFANATTQDANGQTINIVGMSMPGMPVPCYILNDTEFILALNPDTLKTLASGMASSNKGMASIKVCKDALSNLGSKPSTFMVAINYAKYMGWYSAFLKQMLQLGEAKTKAATQNPAGAQNPVAAPVAPVAGFKISEYVDMSLWPARELFETYLGFAASKVFPTEDGFVVDTIYVEQRDEKTAAK
jgi:hypothetical protein